MLARTAFAALALLAMTAAAPVAAQDLITLDAAAIGALPGKTSPEKLTFRPLLQSGGEVASVLVSIPANTDVAPHPHPAGKVAIVTVLSGDFKIGLGDKFDEAKLKTVPAGGMIVLRDNDPLHYARTGASPVELLLVAAPRGMVTPALLGAKN